MARSLCQLSIIGAITLNAALPLAAGKDLYTLDTSWQPRFPSGSHSFSAVGVAHLQGPGHTAVYVTQRGNTALDPVLVMNAADGSLITSWGKESVGLDPTTKTWGAHGLAVEECHDDCEPREGEYSRTRVYIDDFVNHTLTMYTGSGKRLLRLGTNGVAGNGTSPLQFGNIADTAIETGSPSYVYSSDGDGGSANRVVKVAVDGHNKASFGWATKQIYHNPHSIAIHERSGLLIVADREHNETRLLHASTGEDLGAWDCGLDYGKFGMPFGVRTLQYHEKTCNQDLDLILVAIMDNPQDGANQKIAVVDASGLSEAHGAKSKCKVLQEIKIDTKFSGPHLLGVDSVNGDIYAALVSDKPLGTVLRFTCTGCCPAETTIQI